MFTMSNVTVDPSYIPLVPGSPVFDAPYEDYSTHNLILALSSQIQASDVSTGSSLIGSWFTMLLCGIALAQVT